MSTVAPAAPLPPAPAALPVPRLSIEEFLARYANVPGTELVKGIVKEATMPSPKHGFLCLEVAWLIKNHVAQQDLGRVASNDSFVRTGPDSLRGGDVCFWSYERLPRGPVPEGVLPVAPDLVVEVKSPSDRWIDLFAKVPEYLGAGVRVVVILDPQTVTASVYRSDELQQILGNSDALTLPDVLPGFSVTVNQLFA